MKRMQEIDFCLSHKNIKDIPFHKYKNDFTFIANGKRYFIPRIIADILSPKVRKFHFTDECVNEFYITTKFRGNQSNENDHFGDFLQILNFEQIKLDSSLANLYSTYFYELGNIDEYLRLQQEYFATITIENVVDRLLLIQNISIGISEEFDHHNHQIKEMISFIASHFEDINKEKLEKLSIDLLERIVQTESLKIKDEDSLFSFIFSLFEKDQSYSVLFEHILFPNLSEKSLELFISTFSINFLNQKIWNSICSRLFQSNSINLFQNQRYIQPDYIEFKPDNIEFDGIMRYLTKKTGGNIHDNGTINITTNSIHNNRISDRHPKNLVDYEINNFYNSDNNSDIFIRFDFKDKKIQLSSYQIKSYKDKQFNGHLRNWVIEVSNDGLKWEEVDRHTNDPKLNESSVIATFDVSNKNDNFYRFVQIRQTGYSWYKYPSSNFYYFYFYFIEFFGKLKETYK